MDESYKKMLVDAFPTITEYPEEDWESLIQSITRLGDAPGMQDYVYGYGYAAHDALDIIDDMVLNKGLVIDKSSWGFKKNSLRKEFKNKLGL